MAIKVGIYGAAGYTAGELIRLLVNHPEVEMVSLQSESQAGKKVFEVHKDLIGDLDLTFSEAVDLENLDLLFLCKGHGDSLKFIQGQGEIKCKIIDLSTDFRPRDNQESFVYGLPELNRDAISKAKRVANPGCFATCIQLGLLPAVSHQLVDSDIHISGITGSTGAGVKLSPTSHYSWRHSNTSVYKPFTHQHLSEIGESFMQLYERFSESVRFIPYRGSFTRGIITTSYFSCDASIEIVKEYYKSFYDNHPFTHVVDTNPDLKQVVNTNKALIYLEKHEDQLMVISIIDNLLKGASGQAVQNMNIMYGLEETLGIKLKSTSF